MVKRLLPLSLIASLASVFILNAALLNPDKFSNKSNPTSINKKIAYTIETKPLVIDGKILESGKLYQIERLPQDKYLSNAIHVKLKNKQIIGKSDKGFTNQTLSVDFAGINITEIYNTYDDFKMGDHKEKQSNEKLSANFESISRIYTIYYESAQDPYEVCMNLMNNPEVEYAVPVFRRDVYDYTPNDPHYSKQPEILKMNMPKAWEITKGSPDVKIAIVDSGTEWRHEDLSPRIWKNSKEIPNNNIDDDNNGKVDDVNGWDFVGTLATGQFIEDNEPTNDGNFHGTSVAGCAAAATDNGIGVASTGFNCSIIPVKCGAENNGGIFRGYDGVLYSALLGADIINCSWGGAGTSPAEQEMISTAYNLGSVIVVASGNDNRLNIDEGGQYPAGYDNVFAVGATRDNDVPAGFTNIGIKVDVYAPGEAVFTTVPKNGYNDRYSGIISGTSFSSPFISGIMGLLVTLHPDWTPDQLMKQIRLTADDVLNQGNNRPYFYGRVNAFKALDLNRPGKASVPAVLFVSKILDGTPQLNDFTERKLKIKLKNILGNASGVNITFQAMDNYISLGQQTISLGAMAANAEKDIELPINLLPNNPWFFGKARILATVVADGYTDYELIEVDIQVNSSNQYKFYTSFSGDAEPNWSNTAVEGFNNVWAVGTGGYFSYFNIASGMVRILNGQISVHFLPNEPIYAIEVLANGKMFVASSPTNGSTKVYTSNESKSQTQTFNWTNISTSSVSSFINEIHFFDNSEGIYLGDPINGKWGVRLTSNGGSSWYEPNSIPNPASNENGFVGSFWWRGELGWFGTNNGKIYRTRDRGNSWQASQLSGASLITQIAFKDDNNGLALYDEGNNTNTRIIARTANGGTSWTTSVYNFATNGYYPLEIFADPVSKDYYVQCLNGEILASSDNGSTWRIVLSREDPDIKYSRIVTDGNSVKPSGRSWRLGEVVSHLQFGMTPLNVKNDISISEEDGIIEFDTVDISKSRLKFFNISNDGNVDINISTFTIQQKGNTSVDEFELQSTPPTMLAPEGQSNIRLRFAPKSEGLREATVIIQSDGTPSTINLKLTGYGKSTTSAINYPTQKDGYEIKTSLPNPANEDVVVPFNLPSAGYAKLSICDLTGNDTGINFDGYMSEGYKLVPLNVGSLPEGFYLMKLDVNGYTLYNSMVISR